MKKKNSTPFGLLLGLFLFTLTLSVNFLTPAQAQSKQPEGTVIRGERPPIDIATVPVEAMEQGIIRIKFNRTLERLLDNGTISSNPDGSVRFGISGIDQLNQQFGVFAVKKTFDAALQNTKYTERHRQWGFHLWYDLFVPAGTDIRSIVMAYSAKNELEISEPVYKKQLIGADINPLQSPLPAGDDAGLSYTPNDPRYIEQWHYNNTGQQGGTIDADIDLPEAWDITRGNTDVIVAIIDQGIEFTHGDLAANMWSGIGYNFVNNNSTIIPGDHGTHVAGTVAGNTNNAIGVSGIAGGSGTGNGVRLMSCQVFIGSSDGSGFGAAAIWAADHGAAISQNSWGYNDPGFYEQATLDGIDYFNAYGGGTVLNGGITIYAAGNSGTSGLYYPACYSGVFSVAATGNQDLKAWYSNFDTWIDIAAPGGETNTVVQRGVLSTLTGNTYGFYQGTSMACPHVSGVAALILSSVPGVLTPQNLKDILTSTTDDIYSLNPSYIGKLGSGRLNAYQALLATLIPTANFSASPTAICTGGSATFTNLSYGNPTSWSWSFPGGTPSSYDGENPPAVTYATPGSYTVTLTVTDGVTTDTETKTSYINVQDVFAEFTGVPLSIFEDGSVTFTDNSSCEPTSWEWSFPGGSPSSYSGQNPPAITYTTSGTYNVSLIVSKPGATDTETKTAYITVTPPEFNMTNGSVTTCSASFYDSGGLSGDYLNNEDYTFTFYPGTPGAMIRAAFSAFNVESVYDNLIIYDGINTSATLIGTYTGTNSPGTITASNGSGALTFRFTSDNSVVRPGWAAAISCSCETPITYNVTGGGSYCEGGVGVPVGLDGSQVGVNYTILPGTLVVPGDGNAITFGNQLAGSYTVTAVSDGTNPEICAGTVNMTGGADVTTTPVSTAEFTVSACDTYTWALNGATYTASGDFTFVDGCVTNILHLTITPGSTEEFTESACDTYTWALNGATYNASGDYTYVDGCVTNILHLTITATVTPAVSIVASANNVVAGTSVTFTATPVNGGTAAYAWFVNDLPAGTNNVGLTYVPENNDAVYVVMTSSLTCVSAPTALSNTINMVVTPVIPAGAVWIGVANNGDWFTAGNWDTGVPGAITNVTIPGGLGANYPINAGVCNNLLVENGASLMVNPVVGGTATVQSFVPADQYHFISSPVASATAGSVFPLSTFMRKYEELQPTQQWVNITGADVLTPFVGYSTFIPAATGNQTVNYVGALNDGPYSNSGLTFNANSTPGYDGYNLLGNPYASRINLDGGVTLSNVDNAIYFWNPSINNYSYWVIGGAGVNGASANVPVGQGFFVKVSTPGTGTFAISNTVRTNAVQPFYKSSINNMILLKVEGGIYSDETMVRFEEQATSQFDSRYDAYKLKASAVNHLYTKSTDGYELAINTLPSAGEFNVIPVYMEVAENNTYVITASMLESITLGSQVWIEDLKTGITQNLMQNPSLEFEASVGDDTERFRLKVSSLAVPELSVNALKVWFDGDNIRIENHESRDGLIIIRNIAGQEIASFTQAKGSSGSYKVACAPGLYLVSVETSNGIVTNKLVIW